MLILVNDTILIVLLILVILLLLYHVKKCKEQFDSGTVEGIISAESANQLASGVKMSITQRRSDNLAFIKSAKKVSKSYDGQVVSQPFIGT